MKKIDPKEFFLQNKPIFLTPNHRFDLLVINKS